MKQSLTTKMLLIGTLILSFGFQSCSSVKTIDQSKLEGYWQLKTLKGESASEAFKTPVPDLKFNFAENNIYGTGGCNRYTGVFTLTEKNEFSAKNPVATMRACMDANKEPQFFAALSTPNMKLSLEDEGNTLLFSKGSDVILEFVKSEEPLSQKDILGQWVLTYIADGDVNKLFETKKPTLNLTEDGNVVGQGGCNSIRTSYSLEGNTIKFNAIMSTKMACPSLEGEGMFTSLLSTPLQVEAKDGKLSLFKDKVLVLEFGKETIE